MRLSVSVKGYRQAFFATDASEVGVGSASALSKIPLLYRCARWRNPRPHRWRRRAEQNWRLNPRQISRKKGRMTRCGERSKIALEQRSKRSRALESSRELSRDVESCRDWRDPLSPNGSRTDHLAVGSREEKPLRYASSAVRDQRTGDLCRLSLSCGTGPAEHGSGTRCESTRIG